MLWTGIYNYFMLKASWGRKSQTSNLSCGTDATKSAVSVKVPSLEV